MIEAQNRDRSKINNPIVVPWARVTANEYVTGVGLEKPGIPVSQLGERLLFPLLDVTHKIPRIEQPDRYKNSPDHSSDYFRLVRKSYISLLIDISTIGVLYHSLAWIHDILRGNTGHGSRSL